MNMIEFLKEMNHDKASAFYSEIINAAANAEENPIQLLVGLKIVSDTFEEIRESLMPLAISELDKYGSKEVPLFGALLSKIDAGVRWDFEVCGDKVWDYLKKEEKEIASRRQEREAVLKKFNGDLFLKEYVNEETAELVERPPRSPQRKSTTTISIEFAKPKKARKNRKNK